MVCLACGTIQSLAGCRPARKVLTKSSSASKLFPLALIRCLDDFFDVNVGHKKPFLPLKIVQVSNLTERVFVAAKGGVCIYYTYTHNICVHINTKI